MESRTKYPYIWVEDHPLDAIYDPRFYWRVRGTKGPEFATIKEAQIDLMWYLKTTGLMKKGEVIKL